MKLTQMTIIILLLVCLLIVFSFILFTIITQAQMYHYPYDLFTPTPNIR